MATSVHIPMHGELSKQKPKWGSVTPGGQREGEVLFVRRHWGASPQRNAAYNRRPDWPHRQHKEIHHWLALCATSLTAFSHTSIQMQIGGQTQTHNNWTADNGAGGRHTKPTGPFWGWESCPTLTAGEGFIRAVGAVGPSITVPMARDAAAAGAAKLTLGTCGSSYVEDEEKHEITWRTRCVCVLTCWWGRGINTKLFLPLLYPLPHNFR